jgi:hypothetical protein
MNYHFTIALIVLTTIINNGNCHGGNASENGEPGAGEKPKLKLENEPIFMNLVVKALFDSPKCELKRTEKYFNFLVHDKKKKWLITEAGLKVLKEVKYPCKIQLQMSQLNKHDSLKRDLEALNGDTLSDGYMTDGVHKSVKAISGELLASILQEMKVIFLLDVTSEIAVFF